MTVDELIQEAWHNRTGPADGDEFTLPNLSGCLRFALSQLLESLDYEADPSSGGAVTARILATLITNADELSERHVTRN
jgi:hypothetical protein